jgi:hypothetical protein
MERGDSCTKAEAKSFNEIPSNIDAQVAKHFYNEPASHRESRPLFERAKEVSYLPSHRMEIPSTDPAIRNGDFLFCKTLDWASEEEVRLIRPYGSGGNVRIDPRWLTRIILGKDMSSADKELIRDWAKYRDPELVVQSASYEQTHGTMQLWNVAGLIRIGPVNVLRRTADGFLRRGNSNSGDEPFPRCVLRCRKTIRGPRMR